jgi:hypothetical protein
MANEEHLARLKQGVEVWNQWRYENHETVPDLSMAPRSAPISTSPSGGSIPARPVPRE